MDGLSVVIINLVSHRSLIVHIGIGGFEFGEVVGIEGDVGVLDDFDTLYLICEWGHLYEELT